MACSDGALVFEAAEGPLKEVAMRLRGLSALAVKAGLWVRVGIGEMTAMLSCAAREWRRSSAS